MDLFPDGGSVRLRSRAADLYLHADEDGVGVSLSPSRASTRSSWEVLHAERHGGAYHFLLCSADTGHYLALSADPAPPGSRGLRAVQSEPGNADAIGVTWSARPAGDTGRDILLRHTLHGYLRPMGCAGAGVVLGQGGRSSTLPRWSVEAAPPPQLLHPAVGGGDVPDGMLAHQQALVVVREEMDPPAPAATANVEADQLARLQQALLNKRARINDVLEDLRGAEEAARATGQRPLWARVLKLHDKVLRLRREYDDLTAQAAAARDSISAEDGNPPSPPRERPLDETLPASVRRRLPRHD